MGVCGLAKKVAKRVVDGVALHFVFPLAYRYFARKPIAQRRVLFFEDKESVMPAAFSCMWQRCEEDPALKPRYYSLQRNQASHFQYLKRSVWGLHELSRAEAVFLANEASLVNCIKLRSETRIAQIPQPCSSEAADLIFHEMLVPPLNAPGKVKAAEVLAKENPSGIDVSIVVPAYNAMPELERALNSVLEQTYPKQRMELVVTDDCSTDGTWDTLLSYKAKYPNLLNIQRLMQPSGSPAKPRNAGLERAQGKYVFFLDADDWLGKEAVERMLDHAVEWESDVLLVKMRGENGREVPKSMFTRNQSAVDVCNSKVFWNIGPIKLFRSELLKQNDIHCFEGGMPEDLHLVVPAMKLANVVSVAADYDYCHISLREERGANATLMLWNDFESNAKAYAALVVIIERLFTEEEYAAVLRRRLIATDCAKVMEACELGLSSATPEQARELCGAIENACRIK